MPCPLEGVVDMSPKRNAEQKAKHGEKMIEIKVRFWTNGIANGDGKVIPKHAWTSGVVRMERNDSHGIVPQSPTPFHSLMDLNAVMERVLQKHGVVLHPSLRMQKYLSEE
jgi:hypothetical protein